MSQYPEKSRTDDANELQLRSIQYGNEKVYESPALYEYKLSTIQRGEKKV